MEQLPPRRRQDTCESPSQRNSLTVAEARQRLRGAIQAVGESEPIALKYSLGRIIAVTLLAPLNVPPYDNSAMDGYAVRGADLPAAAQCHLAIIGTAFAGAPFTNEVKTGQCVRIMTGGAIPRGCDTIIMREQAECSNDVITIGAGHRIGQYVRRAAEDLATGQAVLKAGKCITPADMGLLASLGIDNITVSRRPRVAFFSTGDELRTSDASLDEGAIYDSNRTVLYGLLLNTGVEPLDLGIVRDDRDTLRKTLIAASAQADAIITTGGVSVGDADFVRETLAALGEVHFWTVGIKPGRPFVFGRIAQSWFFGLPGNPVSALVTYYQFVQPALRQMMGEQIHSPLQFKVPCSTALKKAPGRMEFQRGILETDANGETVVRSTGGQGSNILRSMSEANCFIVLSAECGDVTAGTLVDVQPFSGL